jgi:hypothetical protein
LGKRSEILLETALDSIYWHHPYLLLFQKEDWKEYTVLIAQIYDFIEEENQKVPFEVVKTLILKFYSARDLASIDTKIFNFFQMAIGELHVLKDSHDQFGQRFIETTRSGKMLLQMIEGLLERRTKFSGTGAEVLLGALNDILSSRRSMSDSEAIEHHKAKIRSYKDDLEKIRKHGISHAELLPIPHSNEALFNQAEEAAAHILSSIEDVKVAIERQRQDLAQGYFEGSKTAGQSVTAVADFYQRLYSSSEYLSYIQAKSLLSHLEGYSARFTIKNIDHLLHQIRQKDLLPNDQLRRSQLQGFMQQFQNSDHAIQEKVKAQIKLLQQQVHYATSTDVNGLQNALHVVLSRFLANKEKVIDYFRSQPAALLMPADFESGPVDLSRFEVNRESEGIKLENSELDPAELKALFLSLARAEETNLKKIVQNFKTKLQASSEIYLSRYVFEFGLTEYYVLSEIELFDSRIEKTESGVTQLEVSNKQSSYIVKNVPNYKFTMRQNDGIQ